MIINGSRITRPYDALCHHYGAGGRNSTGLWLQHWSLNEDDLDPTVPAEGPLHTLVSPS